MPMNTIFLKLGGSLITDKSSPYTARIGIIQNIADQIRKALLDFQNFRLIIGHGSGSFGHAAAKYEGYLVQDSLKNNSKGFQTIWFAAHSLNQIVINVLNDFNLPVVSFPPSAAALSDHKKIISWNKEPILSALENNMIPVIFGDIIFDKDSGGIIYSTEELFLNLLNCIQPKRILLAGIEPGVWADFPQKTRIINKLNKKNYQKFQLSINSSMSIDVTGGMRKKIELMFKAQELHPEIEINIFSGESPGAIYESLAGNNIGTSIQPE